MELPFTKMHGLGNDFAVVDLVSHQAVFTPARIQQLGDRHLGIGFDQLLVIEPPSEPGVDFDYRIFNTDGREVEHCGNGARCFATYVREKGLTQQNPIRVKTLNRILSLQIEADGQVKVDMEPPVFTPAEIPFKTAAAANTYSRDITVNGKPMSVNFTALSMGNPHAVITVEDLDKTAVKEIGTALGSHPDFPAGVNVGFMQIIDRKTIKLRVFERGAGETLACGTGACAAVVAGCLLGQLDDTVTVNVKGGQLRIQWQQNDSPVFMTGPTTTVYEGTIRL